MTERTDTRDLAIRADEAGKSAHKRLDTINGQIGRLGASHEKIREDTAAGFAKLAEDFSDGQLAVVQMIGATNIEVSELKTTLSNTLKVAAVIVTAALGVCTGLTIYALEQVPHHDSSPPAQAAPQGK